MDITLYLLPQPSFIVGANWQHREEERFVEILLGFFAIVIDY